MGRNSDTSHWNWEGHWVVVPLEDKEEKRSGRSKGDRHGGREPGSHEAYIYSADLSDDIRGVAMEVIVCEQEPRAGVCW